MLVKYECPLCGHEQYDFVINGDDELHCEQCGADHVAEDVLSDAALEQLYVED